MIAKSLGIWMDHANAHLMEITIDPIQTKVVELNGDANESEFSLEGSEKLIHNKEQHQQLAYYKKLVDIIQHYEDVLLFGPTDAKTELLNIIRAEHHFDKIKIEVKQTDKLTENQEHAFVQDYFSKR